MNRRHRILAFLLIWGSAALARATEGPLIPHPPGCERGQQIQGLIQSALRERGTAEQTSLSLDEMRCAPGAPIPAREALEVLKMRWDAVSHTLEFRLRCSSPKACLPFLVRLPMPAGESAPVFARPGQPASRSAPRDRSTARAHISGPPMVKPGQVVTLVWGDGGMRMSRQVVCLDSGNQGQEVRTRGKQGGRIVHARVAGAGLVEALL